MEEQSQSPENKGKSNKKQKQPKPDAVTRMAGEGSAFVKALKPFLPQDLVGGSLPHIAGTEDNAVWNAAAQALGTEKVYYTYTVDDGRVWYLACTAASIGSDMDSWCPLAAALPGNGEYWDKETVYLYEFEGLASALRWDPETGRMQVFLGASRTILPRVQSLDANFVTIDPVEADIVPWRSKQLRIEQLSRAVLRLLAISGLIVALGALGLIFFSITSMNMIHRDLDSIKDKTDRAAQQLIVDASNVMQSDPIKHMVRVQELLDTLSKVDGTLVKYEVNSGKVQWEALIPPAFAQRFGKPEGLEDDGRARVKGSK